MTIDLQATYEIRGNLPVKTGGPVQFSVPTPSGVPVTVEIAADGKSVVCHYRTQASATLHAAFPPEPDESPLTKEQNAELKSAYLVIRSAIDSVFRWIRFYLNRDDVPESPADLKELLVSADEMPWYKIPPWLGYYMRARNDADFDGKAVELIQGYLDTGHEPFVAFHHLRRACDDDNPRHKWIDATIAAELAIKECLIRLEPKLKALLLEVPSPPLAKLYGSILEAYSGVQSPKRKEIAKGVEIRNKLVHQPSEIEIDLQHAINYVEAVEIAIFHLLSLLYPDDAIIDKITNRRLSVSRVK